jgi:hypothetical protein
MKMRKKSDLPVKTCRTCARPFTWRRKWARDWDNVLYCSDRCRGARKGASRSQADDEQLAGGFDHLPDA